MSSVPDVHILGAGPAGLGAGWYSRRAGLDCHLFEAADQVGGNTRTLSMGDFRYDTGAHRFHDKDPAITREIKDLLGDELRRIDVPSQIYWRGRWIDFPLAPFDLAAKLPWSILARVVGENLALRMRSTEEPKSFHHMATNRYGQTLAREFLISYTEKLWGRKSSQLVPEVAGGRLDGLDLKTFLLEMVGGRRRRVRHLDGSFFYPAGGFGRIAEAIAEEIGWAHISTGTRVTSIEHSGGTIEAVQVNDDAYHPVETVISSLPCTLAAGLFEPSPPDEILGAAEQMSFRDLRLVVLGLDRSRFTSNASVYFPGRRFPFTRIYEPKNRSPDLAPSHQTAIVVELPTARDGKIWTMSSDSICDQVVEILQSDGLLQGGEVVARTTHRVPFAYPVLDLNYRDRLQTLTEYLTTFRNFHLVGRGAEFHYRHTHELLADARDVVENDLEVLVNS